MAGFLHGGWEIDLLLAALGFIWLLTTHLIGLSWVRGPFLLQPARLFLGLSLLKTLPYAILSFLYIDLIDPRVLLSIGYSQQPEIIIQFCFLYGIYILFYVITIKLLLPRKTFSLFLTDLQKASYNFDIQFTHCVFLVLIGLLLFFLKVRTVGGFTSTIYGEELSRTGATAGLGYFIGLSDFVAGVTSAATLIYWGKNRTFFSLILTILMLLLVTVSFSMFGGRKALMQHILLLLVLWSIYIKPIKLNSKVAWTTFILLSFYFVVILRLRLSHTESALLNRFDEFSVFSSVITFLSNLSYNDTYYFLINYFDSDNKLLLGETFSDLFYAVLPSRVFPDKPPVDEGVYVKALLEGAYSTRSAPASSFLSGSMPPETFGVFIMNFGWISLPIAGCLMAWCFWLAMKLLRKLRVGFIPLYVFFHAVLNFQLSNLRIVSLLSSILFACILALVFRLQFGQALLKKLSYKKQHRL